MGYNAAPEPADGATEAQASADDPAPDTELEPDYLDEATTDFDVKFKWGENPVTLRELREAYDSRTAPAEIARERQEIAAQREAWNAEQGKKAYLNDRENPIKYLTGYLNDVHSSGVDVKELHAVLNEALVAAIETGRIDPKAYETQASAIQQQRAFEAEKVKAQNEVTQYRLQAQVAQIIAKHSDITKTDPKTGDKVIKPEAAQKILDHVDATHKATGKMLTLVEAATELVNKKAFAAPQITKRMVANDLRKKAPATATTKTGAKSVKAALDAFYTN